MVCLSSGERVVAAWAERCDGPGWSNTLVWVLVRTLTGSCRAIAIQPNEQTAGMRLLFGVTEEATRAMTAEVRIALKERR